MSARAKSFRQVWDEHYGKPTPDLTEATAATIADLRAAFRVWKCEHCGRTWGAGRTRCPCTSSTPPIL